MKLSLSVFDIEENNDAGDVINYIFLAFPLLESRTHQIFSSAFGIALQKVRIYDVSDLLIFEELPDAVTRQNNDFIRRCHSKLSNFGNGIDSDPSSNLVTEGPTHSQPWNVFIFEPDAFRSHFISLAVSIRVDTTTRSVNHLRFLRVIWFVISR